MVIINIRGLKINLIKKSMHMLVCARERDRVKHRASNYYREYMDLT